MICLKHLTKAAALPEQSTCSGSIMMVSCPSLIGLSAALLMLFMVLTWTHKKQVAMLFDGPMAVEDSMHTKT